MAIKTFIKIFTKLQNLMQKKSFIISTSLSLLLIAVYIANFTAIPNLSLNKVNDWEYKSTSLQEGLQGWHQNNTSKQSLSPTADLGFSAEGVKDVNNFRDNIKNGYLPIPRDITHEGIYYNYFLTQEYVKNV